MRSRVDSRSVANNGWFCVASAYFDSNIGERLPTDLCSTRAPKPRQNHYKRGKAGHRRLLVKPSWTVQKQLSWPSSVCQWKNGYDSKQIMSSGSGCVMNIRSDRLLMATCAVTSCKCRPTGVPLYYYHVRVYSFVTVSTKSHPNHTCSDEEWAFLWSRPPLFSWAKILFIIVRRYACMMIWAY